MSAPNIPSGDEKTLTPKQRAAIVLLASGSTIKEAAKAIKCNEKSIDNWKHHPEFLAALHKAEDEVYDEALRVLKKAARPAINCLLRNMDSKVSAYVQVQAAGKLLDAGLEIHKIAALEQEVAELRQLLQAKEDQWQQ
jgi:transposase